MDLAGEDPATVAEWLSQSLAKKETGIEMPFTTFSKDGEIAGSTRYMNIDGAHKRVEIGNTWLAPKWQRTALNTEAKLLMMTHAFETLGCIRVEYKTHHRNEASRNAILRLGAKQEGILRRHMIHKDGTYRDSVYFSVLDDEWPAVKAGLEAKLAAHSG